MVFPIHITANDFPLSQGHEQEIRGQAAELGQSSDCICKCRVVVEAPLGGQADGPYNVRINVSVPDTELVVNRQATQDLSVAIQAAFEAARRRIEEYEREHQACLPLAEGSPAARVKVLSREQGYGFLETADGREVYFHRNCVRHAAFDRLAVGMEVYFTEEQGETGPQASTVIIVGHYGT